MNSVVGALYLVTDKHMKTLSNKRKRGCPKIGPLLKRINTLIINN